ncbi:MAG: FAD-dependent oxidoreductase [Spirochaetaceae bacterium]|nr:FAD-dependent oxidoreductase [Spirochaetaceae bacterium]
MKTMSHYDVIVIGGGPAGAMAAIAAGRNGAKTLVVEQYGYLGGALTAGGTGPQMTYHAGGRQVIDGIPGEFVRRMIQEGFSPGHMEDFVGYAGSVTPFDGEGMKLVLENMVLESGAEPLYHTVYTGCDTREGNITGVRLFSKNGFFGAQAKVYIDASADADMAVHAGVRTEFGRKQDGLAQPMTMNLKISNVDRERLMEYVLNNRDDMLQTVPFDRLREIPRTGVQGGYRLVQKARAEGTFTVDRNQLLCFETNNRGEFIVNMSRIIKKSGVDPFDLTAAEIEGRRQCFELFRFLRENVPGFENSVMISTGPNIGIRESRRINGVYTLTAEDLLGNVMFDDAIAMGGYPIDIHSPDGLETSHAFLKSGSWYSVPYRSLISPEVPNLLVAGRCISVTHEALAAVRVTPLVMAMGQAAGTAAALAAKTGVAVQSLNTDTLRKTLVRDGAFLEPYEASSVCI